MPYPFLFDAEKSIPLFAGWSAPEPDTRYMWFNAPLELAGVVETGFFLHGGCIENRPDVNVSFELVATSPGSKRKVNLGRLDWRSIRGTHRNQRYKGWPLRGKLAPATHYHSFELNWDETTRQMRRGDLPQATELPEEPLSFESLRDLAGKLFRINNIDIVERPEWAYTLL